MLDLPWQWLALFGGVGLWSLILFIIISNLRLPTLLSRFRDAFPDVCRFLCVFLCPKLPS